MFAHHKVTKDNSDSTSSKVTLHACAIVQPGVTATFKLLDAWPPNKINCAVSLLRMYAGYSSLSMQVMEIGADFASLGNHMWVSQQQAGDVIGWIMLMLMMTMKWPAMPGWLRSIDELSCRIWNSSRVDASMGFSVEMLLPGRLCSC